MLVVVRLSVLVEKPDLMVLVIIPVSEALEAKPAFVALEDAAAFEDATKL